MISPPRRRFLSVCAAAGVFTAMPWSRVLAAAPLHRWHGILLGAQVELTIAHPDTAQAQRLFSLCVREIKRLENIFTLYDSRSELSRLNADGLLASPSPDMYTILQQARLCHTITEGAFDVTVRPLEKQGALDLVGMDKLDISPAAIRFTRPGMGVTLNGIGQGYITDRITALLDREGLVSALVELGEKRAIGMHPDGRPWFLALPDTDRPAPLSAGLALATSAARSPDTGRNHIYVPQSGRFAQAHNSVSVVAESAALADALSTGFMALPLHKVRTIEEQNPQIKATYFS
ncbi:MAG: FAD:protein FMN transferase [Alphaproteobacteria bacterium]|nr:FAD:protein FMN transferase [Alphaproteobacteria bacterium]